MLNFCRNALTNQINNIHNQFYVNLINPERCFFENMYQEFQLLPELARRQPPIDKAKLENASSVEEALDIARGSLQAAV
jgi:hypothetical protein